MINISVLVLFFNHMPIFRVPVAKFYTGHLEKIRKPLNKDWPLTGEIA